MGLAADAIAALNRALAAVGEDVTLTRNTLTLGVLVPTAITCRAVVRGYQPAELIGGIIQGDSLAILSPTEIANSSWPGPVRHNDKLTVQGRERNIEAAAPIYAEGELVRIELQLRG